MSNKLWEGRSDGQVNAYADELNSSIGTDKRMYRQDIKGSMAHAAMLGAQNIISPADADEIIAGLECILSDIESGALEIDESFEDIHTFVEATLTKRIGDAGKKLHTARSRNDQVATDLRLYLADEIKEITALTAEVIEAICEQAAKNKDAVMPGYTHMQRAQPVTFGHYILAYAMMLTRDITRLKNAAELALQSPLGCCALAGTTYNTDRNLSAQKLGFNGVMMNSLDGVSDRDFCIELCSALSILMMHLSRFSEELILWASWEFKFIEFTDSFSTGSSIMPQKKNPDMAELVRGKTARVYGDLITLLTLMKGLPLAYNKDMQEDKDAIFDAVDTVKLCLSVFAPMIATVSVNRDNMRKAAAGGFINATDCADYLTKKGLPFRTAYKLTGQIVADCIKVGITLEDMSLERYKEYNELFDSDIYTAVDLDVCVSKRCSLGGPSIDSIDKQLEYLESFVKNI